MNDETATAVARSDGVGPAGRGANTCPPSFRSNLGWTRGGRLLAGSAGNRFSCPQLASPLMGVAGPNMAKGTLSPGGISASSSSFGIVSNCSSPVSATLSLRRSKCSATVDELSGSKARP